MPMRRNAVPASPISDLPRWLTRTGAPSALTTQRLAALFRQAARCALGSTLLLTAAACGQTQVTGGPFGGAGVGITGGSGGTGAGSGAVGGTAGLGGAGGSHGDFDGGSWLDAGRILVADGGAPNPMGWIAFACPASGSFDLSTIKLAAPVDYISWRYAGQPPTEIASHGTPCATAPDVAACTQLLQTMSDGVPPSVPADGGVASPRQFLITTHGADVRVAVTTAEQAALLAPIDSEAKAVMMAALSDLGLWIGQACFSQVQTRRTATGFEVQFDYNRTCGGPSHHAVVAVATDGTVSLVSDVVTSTGTGCQTGRRPQGLQPTSAHDAAHDSLGDFFAEVAYLEAASVDAFRVIAAELRHHGAPAELIAQAERAADEEVVHAELTARLSHRFGQLAPTPQVAPQPLRELEAFARDNAVEGCVRETYGAALATYQAQAAADDEIRAALQLIARDETRHASLSWQIATWVTPKLDDAASARVRQAQAEAVLELTAALRTEPSSQLQLTAGMPSAASARTLISTLDAELWGVLS